MGLEDDAFEVFGFGDAKDDRVIGALGAPGHDAKRLFSVCGGVHQNAAKGGRVHKM